MSRCTETEQTPSQLADALAAARDDDVAALAAVEAAKAEYEGALLTATDDQLRKLDEAKSATQRLADVSRAKLANLDRRHKAATSPETLAAQRKRRAEAIKKSAAAQKLMTENYPAAAGQLRDIIRALAEAQAAIDASNADATEEKLPSAEAFRSVPVAWKETISESEVTLWRTVNGINQPLIPADQVRVQPNPGKGSREHIHNVRAYGQAKADEIARSGALQTGPHSSIAVVQQRYRRLEVLPDVLPYQARPLAEELVLPAAFAGSSAPWPAMPGTASPDRVLAELAKPAQPRPVVPERMPMFEYEAIFNQPTPAPYSGVVHGAV